MKERTNEFRQAVRRPFNLERVARVTCDVGYLCANFSLPAPLCSRIGHDVRADRQTSDTHDCVMPPTLMAVHNNESSKTSYHWYQKCVYPCGETTFFPTRSSSTHTLPHNEETQISQVCLSLWENDLFTPQDHPVRTNKQQKLNEIFCMVWCQLSATSNLSRV